MNELRILHMADVHLGGSGPAFGGRVREHQQRLEAAFTRAVDLALEERVDAVCIVGDLFDVLRPSERSVQAAGRELARLGGGSPPIPCLIIPGNHDPLEQPGVFHRPEFRAAHLHVWREPGPATFRLPGGLAAFHGTPQTRDQATHSPLEGLTPDPEARFNIALVHGAMLVPGVTEKDPLLITPEQIASCGMDYVALGHWHEPSDRSSGGVTARYSGSTEVVKLRQVEPGGALLVRLSDNGVTVERRRTGTLRCAALTLGAGEHGDEAALSGAIQRVADGDLLLDATLDGLAPEGFTCDVARLQEELEGLFFRLRISDETVPAVDESAAEGVRDSLIAARAVRLLREQMQQTTREGDEEAARLAGRALQVTVALFEGREVVG